MRIGRELHSSCVAQRKRIRSFGRSGWISLGLVVLLSFFTYFYRYTSPPSLFWDEHHHVPHAQKYLNGIYHLEGHPPLGKMLIALGEKLLDANPDEFDALFTSTMVAEGRSDGLVLTGYRFFPALLGWLTAPLLFLIFFLILRNQLAAVLLSFLYIFDNAMPAHFRSAMLDGTLLFFIVLAALSFFLLLEWKETRWKSALISLLFGASFAAAFTTKLTGLILIIFIPALFFPFWPNWKKILSCLSISFVGFLMVFFGVWYAHFSIGGNVDPKLPNNGYFDASFKHRRALNEGGKPPLMLLPSMISNAHAYMLRYNFNVKRLDLCDPGEVGSPAYLWPLGIRSIPLHVRSGTDRTSYLYLQSNPVVWWSSALAVLVSFLLLVSFKPLKNRFLITLFFLMYFFYMAAISSIDRVMYLYHYFPPLILSFILLALVVNEVTRINSHRKTIFCAFFALMIFLSFQFYRPLTYLQPLTDKQIERRAIFPLWNLKCRECERTDKLLIPRDCDATKDKQAKKEK